MPNTSRDRPPTTVTVLFGAGAATMALALLVLSAVATEPRCGRLSACEPVAFRVLVGLLFLGGLATLVGGAGVGAWLGTRRD